MTTHPFLFLGHGEGPGTVDVLACLEDSSARATPLLKALGAWAGRDADVTCHEQVVAVHARLKRSPTLHESLANVLLTVHATTPLALVIRKNRVTPSAWHLDSLAQPGQLLDVLERQVRACSTPYGPLALDTSRRSESVFLGAWSSLGASNTLGALVQGALNLVTTAVKRQKAALVWQDLLMTRLPTWVGLDFGVDLAIVEQLSTVMGVAPTTVEMPPLFKDTFDAMVRANHDRQRWGSKKPKVDWADVAAVRAAIRDGKWLELQTSFVETDRAQVDTLFALTSDERVTLAKHERLGTQVMNVATFRMMSGDFSGALTLYDDALEGTIEASAAANPLYAVADDNNHLGIDPPRARRYLERCVPFGPRNAGIFLNAACLTAELGDLDEALRFLELAKEHGFSVKDHRNERVFVPLRDRPTFKKLMR